MAQRVKKGQVLRSIHGDSWNEFCDTADRVKALPPADLRPGPGKPSGTHLQVQGINTTDADLTSEFPVVRFASPPVVPADNAAIVRQGVRFEVLKPDEENTHWGVMQGPCPKEQTRPVVFMGLSWAKVDIKSKDDTTCGPIDDDAEKLESGPGNATIVWASKAAEEDDEDKLGVQWCVVLLGGGGSSSDSLIAKITSSVSARDGVDLGTGTVALGRIEDGKWTEEIEEAIAYNTSRSPIEVPSGGDIMMAAIKVRGDWVLTPLELHQLAQYDVAKDQSIGHDADGEIEWQEDGDCEEAEEEPEE